MDHDRCDIHESAHARYRCKGWQSSDWPLKMGLTTKIHMAVNKNGVPVRFIATDGVVADCTKAEKLIENTVDRGLIADKGYDSDKIVKFAEKLGIKVIIPSRIDAYQLKPIVPDPAWKED